MFSVFTKLLSLIVLLLATAVGPLTFANDDEANKLAFGTLKGLVGSARDSENVLTVCKKLKGACKIEKFSDSTYYSWKEHGLSFVFDKDDKLAAVFIYASGAEGFKEYQGELPEKLLITDTLGEVESKLGKPKVSGGGRAIPYWAMYPQKGIGVNYVSKDGADRTNRIHHLLIRVEDK